MPLALLVSVGDGGNRPKRREKGGTMSFPPFQNCFLPPRHLSSWGELLSSKTPRSRKGRSRARSQPPHHHGDPSRAGARRTMSCQYLCLHLDDSMRKGISLRAA
ncbi:hypothetical protein BDP81DRAFT_429105, partial [Colletotrichum phormii]